MDFTRLDSQNILGVDMIEEPFRCLNLGGKCLLEPELKILEDAVKSLMAFGPPREGSHRYHAAWERVRLLVQNKGENK